MKAVLRRLAAGEGGMTLIEMLVAAMMSVIVVGASCAMLISAVRDQPALSRKAQNVTTARYQLERIVREIRNSELVETATPTELKMTARVQRTVCGGSAQTDPSAEPIKCKVTFRCSGKTCTRSEATMEGTPVGTSVVALSGIGSTSVFCFVPSKESDPTQCGDPAVDEAPTYVGVNLQVPNPEGPGLLTISDGATLRTATFTSS